MEKNNKDYPKGWEFVPLSQISTVNPRLQNESMRSNFQVSFVPMKCVEELSGKIDLSNSKKYDEVKKGYTYFANGDIIFAKITPCMENGKIAIAKNLTNAIGFGSTEFHVIRLLHKDIPREFYFWYLMQDKFRNIAQHNMKGTAGQLRVPVSFIEESIVPVPPLNEQKRIVAKIEELFSKIERMIDNMETVKIQSEYYFRLFLKSAFSGHISERWRDSHKEESLFDENLLNLIINENTSRIKLTHESKMPSNLLIPNKWKFVLSNDLFTFVTSGSRGWAKYYDELGALFLRVTNLDHNSITVDLRKIKRVNPPKNSEGKRTLVQPNDILISITADVGMVGVIPQNLEKAYVNQHVSLVRPDPRLNSSFIAWFLTSAYGGQLQFQKLQKGVTKSGLGLNDIRNIWIPFPSLKEQQIIVNEIDRQFSNLKQTKFTIKLIKYQLEELRKSILKQAFAGNLVPQDPNDESADILIQKIEKEKLKQIQKLIRTKSIKSGRRKNAK